MWGSLIATASASRVNGSDVREFKAWSRRVWWETHETPRQKARAVLEAAVAPWHLAKDLARAFREYAPVVSREFGIPRRRQLWDLVKACVRHDLDPVAFYRFQLFRPDKRDRAGRYMQNRDTGRVLRWLVYQTPGYVFIFGDKRRFEAWCTGQSIPVVRTLIEFEGGRIKRSQVPDGSLPPADLFSKPSNGQGGDGARRWVFSGDGCYRGSDGQRRDSAALIAELARQSADCGCPIILQPALKNAASDAKLSPGGLCTARITTICPPGGQPQLLFAGYRMPPDAATPADNFALGGLSAPIDLSTGRLGRAVRKDLKLQSTPADRHPQTGARIEGHQLAHWPEATSLVLRAHAAITWKGVPVIGWDVALLDDGPVIVEANNCPCSTLAQMVMDGPLGDSPLVSCLNAHLRECFASARASR